VIRIAQIEAGGEWETASVSAAVISHQREVLAESTCGIQEKTMAQTEKTLVADLHTKAAYAHTAAAYSHSTGDHASAQELAKRALSDSVAAVRYSEEIAKGSSQTLEA
jgi:hypothetical protein